MYRRSSVFPLDSSDWISASAVCPTSVVAVCGVAFVSGRDLRSDVRSANVEVGGLVCGEDGVRHHVGGNAGRLEGWKQLFGLPTLLVGFRLPHGQDAETAVVVRAGSVQEEPVGLVRRVGLLGDHAEVVDRLAAGVGDVDVCHVSCPLFVVLTGSTVRNRAYLGIVRTTHCTYSFLRHGPTRL